MNFNWGNGFGDPNVGAELFSVRWTGRVTPPFSETYRFHANTDDGARLWVNGIQLVDDWTDHGIVENRGNIPLIAGRRYDLVMEYYDNGGGAFARLLWSSPRRPRRWYRPTICSRPPTGSSVTTSPGSRSPARRTLAPTGR